MNGIVHLSAAVWLCAATSSSSLLGSTLLRKESSDERSLNVTGEQRLASISWHVAIEHIDKKTSACRLPAVAKIANISDTQGACLWQPADSENTSPKSCAYNLAGICKHIVDNATGCDFFGYPGNEQYAPAELFLPGPAPGEISLTEAEATTLLAPFQPCDSRPKFYLVSTPPIASPSAPLAILSGGSPIMAQHVYFVAYEMCLGDSYRLALQKEENMKVVVDVGANIGLFSIAVCKRFPNARIIALEPHPANFRFLKANLMEAGCANRVEAYNIGLSRDGRSMKLFWHESIGTSAYRPADNFVHMQTMTPHALQQIIGSDSVVSFFKIDCEGCEYEVVPLLQKQWVQTMFCEVHGATVQTDVDQDTMNAVEKSCREWNPQNWTVVAWSTPPKQMPVTLGGDRISPIVRLSMLIWIPFGMLCMICGVLLFRSRCGKFAELRKIPFD